MYRSTFVFTFFTLNFSSNPCFLASCTHHMCFFSFLMIKHLFLHFSHRILLPNLGFLLHGRIICASLSFWGLNICFYIFHIESFFQTFLLHGLIIGASLAFWGLNICLYFFHIESFFQTLVSCFMDSSYVLL